jgi:hypothetical protein
VGLLAANAPAPDDFVEAYARVGGNGKAAKSSDEIGRLAANLVLAGGWQDDLPAEAFRAHFLD